MNINVGFLALHQFLDVDLELFDLGALLPNDDSRPCGVDVNLGLVRHPLDFDLRDARMIKALLYELAQAQILMQQRGIGVAGIPF